MFKYYICGDIHCIDCQVKKMQINFTQNLLLKKNLNNDVIEIILSKIFENQNDPRVE